jgi:hypothetical protein
MLKSDVVSSGIRSTDGTGILIDVERDESRSSGGSAKPEV